MSPPSTRFIAKPLPRLVLVVGATSHTGERLALRLLRHGVAVRVLTRRPESPIAARLRLAGADLREGDTLRRWTLWEAMEGVEAVASCCHIRHAEALVQGCYRAGVERLVCLSSARRHSRLPQRSVYEVRSAESELMESEQEWTILRPTMIYGGSRDGNIEGMVRWAGRRSWMPVVGSGTALFQPTWVEDLVSAFVEALRRPGSAKRDYDLGGPEPVSWNAFVDLIGQARGKAIRPIHLARPIARGMVRAAPRFCAARGLTMEAIERAGEDRVVDWSPAAEELDYRPGPYLGNLVSKVQGLAEVERLYPMAADGSQALADFPSSA